MLQKKSCKAKVTEFLKQEYVLPKLGIHNGKVVHYIPVKKLQGPVVINDHLAKQMAKKELMEVRHKMYATNRNVKKKLKRRDAIIAQQKACIESQQKEIKMHENKLQGAKHQVDQLRTKLNRLNHCALYWKKNSKRNNNSEEISYKMSA